MSPSAEASFLVRHDPAPGGVGIAITSARVDLGDRQGPEARGAALRALADALGVPVAVCRQVHGRAVRVVDAPPGAPVHDLDAEADALVTTRRGLALAVRVADCVPILLADRDRTVVASVHAGRAGLLSGVIGAAVDAVCARAAGPLNAWIGPHICARCYEVPPDLARESAARLGTAVPTTRWGTTGIDLTGAAERQLAERGVASVHVGGCTLEDDRLHSHRRTPGAGRLAACIWLA